MQNTIAEYGRRIPFQQVKSKEACHHNLYAIANSQAMNGIGPDTTIKTIVPGVITACKTAMIICWIVFAVSLVLWITKRNKFKKTEDYISYQKYKRAK